MADRELTVAQDWHKRLRRLLTEIEGVNGQWPTKLENLVRYSMDEAGAQASRDRAAVPTQQGAGEG